MRLFNTLTRQVDTVEPVYPPKVGVYTCGPTVYDYAHVGHWFTYVRADILIRALKASELEPTWVMNITDVGHLVSDSDEGEDKLEKGAKREGKTAWQVAEFYTEDFKACMQLLNITAPDHMPKATDHIKEQIEIIQSLESKGFTYQIDDGIYYDTSKFPKYSEFARLDLDEQQAGSRVAFNPQKRNASDFALWKFSPAETKRDMEWDSPWGKGFPGWHIECSAMSMKYLGKTIDIHTGGIDHVPVHHANEIAQSEAVTGKIFAKYWLHTNHVLVDGQKISKSLNNGIRLQEVVEKGISTDAFRLHVLESHYRSQSKFSWDSLQAAQNRLNDLKAMAALRWQTIPNDNKQAELTIADISPKIVSLLADDLKTPQIVMLLSQLSNQLQSTLISTHQLDEFNELLSDIDKYLGLNLFAIKDIDDASKSNIQAREAARKSQDWAKSDEIRDNLLKQGIGLRDTSQGAIWYPE
jgi:cysteinyl-tRNA synthetase